jgi:hypothetical protein
LYLILIHHLVGKMFTQSLLLAISLGLVGAAVPANETICDYYTTLLFDANNPATQMLHMTKLVNTVVVGNYTPGAKNLVPGILAAGTFDGTTVNLLPYFDGTLASSNAGGYNGSCRNFLDDGGAAPLLKDLPSNGNTASRQL